MEDWRRNRSQPSGFRCATIMPRARGRASRRAPRHGAGMDNDRAETRAAKPSAPPAMGRSSGGAHGSRETFFLSETVSLQMVRGGQTNENLGTRG